MKRTVYTFRYTVIRQTPTNWGYIDDPTMKFTQIAESILPRDAFEKDYNKKNKGKFRIFRIETIDILK